jgi:hypothetical protein
MGPTCHIRVGASKQVLLLELGEKIGTKKDGGAHIQKVGAME